MRQKLFNMKQMKTKILGFFVLLFFVSVPLIYNSCQSGMKAAQQSMQLSSLCVQKTSPFYSEKNNVTQSVAVSSKTVSVPQTSLPSGTKLAVILDNFCTQDNTNQNTLSYLLKQTQSALWSDGNMAGLNKQTYLWTLDRTYSNAEITQIANNDSCVLGLSLNKTYKVQSTQSPSSLFNDPGIYYQPQWQAMNYVEAYPLLFNDTTGIAATGDDILVAVVDTGYDVLSSATTAHADLHVNQWLHRYGDGIDATTIGTNLVSYSPFDASSNGHGTHISGLIAATTNNNVGTMGMVPRRVQIMAIKIFSWDSNAGDITTTSQAVANGIRFAYLNGAKVINLSVGTIFAGVNDDPVMQDAIQDAVAAGSVVVTVIGNASSGNGTEVDGVTLSSIPGQYGKNLDGLITVGSVDADTLNKSYFSLFSVNYTEMMAPGAASDGVGIYSTIPMALGSKSGYGRLMGTSQAAPMVTGAAALVMQFVHDRTGSWPSPAAVENFMKTHATKSAALEDYVKDGNLLNLQTLGTALQSVSGNIGTSSVGFVCF